ncbi:MAG: hypothetical protein LBR66_04115 [Candidatus Symbiothrix sp.]|nr:hypothetical protein [Candidatus Symbiothrix sp.]
MYSKEIAAGGSEMADLFRANVTRYAAYKSFVCDKLLQEDAAKDADKQAGREKMIDRFNRWQYTEEAMVAKRCRRAKQWEEIEAGGFERIKWLPSVSIEKRAEHIPYYNQIFPKDWDGWDKQDVWGCKCSMVGTYRKETPHEWTDENDEVKPLPELKASRGLEGNPARTGEVFTDRAAYVRKGNEEASLFFSKKIREEYLAPIPDGGYTIGYSSLSTGALHIGKKSLRRALNHAVTWQSKVIAKLITDRKIDMGKRVLYEYLGERYDLTDEVMRRKFLAKVKRGVIGYNMYEIEFYGNKYEILMEVSKYGYEQPYVIKQK